MIVYRSYGWEWDRFVAYWHHLGLKHWAFGISFWWAGPNLEIHLPGGFFRIGVPGRWRDHGLDAARIPDRYRTISPFLLLRRSAE